MGCSNFVFRADEQLDKWFPEYTQYEEISLSQPKLEG